MMQQNISEISADDVRRELDVVLRSATFERAERLQKFLQYVCELTLKGEAARINEYLIGNEVFRRGSDYSPHEDSVVRRQAHSLRRKLQEYYEKEGSVSAIRIELPLGRYVPVFRRREESATRAAATIEVPATSPVAAPPARRLRQWMLAAAAGATVLFALGWLVGRSRPPDRLRQLDPAAVEIWGDWLRDPNGVVICFSNPFSLGIKFLPDPLPPDTIPRHLALTPEQAQYAREAFHMPPGGYVYFGPGSAHAKMGEAFSAVELAGLFIRAGAPVRTTQSRFVTWQELPKQDLIVLGSDDINRWVDPLLARQPFRTSATSASKPRAILNAKPEPGEQSEYKIAYAEDRMELLQEYVLISMIPGVNTRRRLLLISGLGTQATQSAAEFLTENAGLRELLASLRKRVPAHVGPWHFQAILSTEVHDRVPTKTSLVALRVLP